MTFPVYFLLIGKNTILIIGLSPTLFSTVDHFLSTLASTFREHCITAFINVFAFK